MPIKRRASTILGAFEKAQTELVGKAVVLADGKAGTVENVWLDEARAGHCRHGPVRCSNDRFRPALCLRHRPARPQRPRLDQRHRKSHGRMGWTSNPGGVSLG